MNRYVALDVETTGLSSKNGDKVIDIGVVAIEDQGIIAEFSSLIDVDKMIPWQVQQMHGITNEMSRKQYPHLPNHKLETVSRYLLGKSCKQMQRHRALDDAKLAAMIWLEMEKI
ncbi:MAG TPA: 3'-5' exonuclease [Candidatus Bathyarchaeia archaeon]|nr:3'-5' exonuclease [Desulfobacterales bacterium]HUU53087.1 3'-5' exonuclease [Candidatus Bathyarchaeia archaeon]